jgi:pimeloyl-ACP methyl ester carboxylesterase
MNMEELADWATRFMNEQKIGRADIVAHSMGCQVALALARRYPERVGRLILVGPTTGKGSVPLVSYFAGMLLGGAREPLVYRLRAIRMFWRMGVRRYVATVRAMMRDAPVLQAGRVQAACLVVRGERDTIISEKAAQSLARALPHGGYQTIPHAAHVVPYSCPDALATLAQTFWQRSPNNSANDTTGSA